VGAITNSMEFVKKKQIICAERHLYF
jgi:hypothetical protein